MHTRRGWWVVLAAALVFSGCGHSKPRVQPPMPPGVTWGPAAGEPPAAKTASSRKNHAPPTPVAGNSSTLPKLRVGEVWQVGLASFYGPQEQGNFTASGERFDYHKLTAAHRLLPFGTRVRVTDLKTHRSVVVTVNDRGPFWPNRVLDLSLGAARRIGVYPDGVDPVRIRIVGLPDPVVPGRYTVQVGWFTETHQLDQCRRMMQTQGPLAVVEFHSSTGRWLRYDRHVSLDFERGESIVRELRGHHFPAYLVRLN